MTRLFKISLQATVAVVLGMLAAGRIPRARAQENRYQLVENWARFPPGFTGWGPSSGVDVDAHDNVYVFQRNVPMPIMLFDGEGRFLRGWGQGLIKSPHFLRVDRFGHVWATDRGNMQAFEFDADGKLLLTLGKKGVTGDNASRDAFNGVADVAVARDGAIFVADGEGLNTRIVKFSRDGGFLKWWGGKGSNPGQFNVPHSIAIDSEDRLYVADRGNNRIQIFDPDGNFLRQWTHFGVPWGVFVKGELIYVVDGSENDCLLIARLNDGRVFDKISGLSNPTAVSVDSAGTIYIAEVNGRQVKKFVRK